MYLRNSQVYAFLQFSLVEIFNLYLGKHTSTAGQAYCQLCAIRRCCQVCCPRTQMVICIKSSKSGGNTQSQETLT
jgi:hypothetical protein